MKTMKWKNGTTLALLDGVGAQEGDFAPEALDYLRNKVKEVNAKNKEEWGLQLP